MHNNNFYKMLKLNKMVMGKGFTTAFVALAALVLASCGSSKKEGDATLNDKKVQLEKLKAEKNKSDAAIRQLEEELQKLDTTAAKAVNLKLVSVAPVTTQNFEHYIDLQGKVDADNISYISPRGQAGQVRAIYIKEGQFVKKGQLVLKLDDAVLQQSIVAGRKGLEGIKTQLAYAKNIYQRQKNLWDQGIGTEVQLITAKTNVESLENQLAATQEGIKTTLEQLNTANVYSDVSGIIEQINIRIGETFMGATAAGPQIKVVNKSSLKVVTNVPENYLTRITKGMGVVIDIPDAGKKINSSISLISPSIEALQRGFIAEARIPSDPALKPNQIAIMRIRDYSSANAVVIPVNVVQSDEKSKYVYVMIKSGNGKMVAAKRPIVVGETYGELVEVKAGLNAGEQLISAGYQNLYEGQLITTS
jgi:membrane fusion protein, multidrug efflux system